MQHEYDARNLSIAVFAQEQGKLTLKVPMQAMDRLSQETVGSVADVAAHVVAQGSVREDAAGGSQVWLHVTAEVALPMVCQRCLGPVDIPVVVDREFRFVVSEVLAEAQDEVSEEDVLVFSREFDLLALVEDEFLMGLPAVPKHEDCPVPVTLHVQDPNFESAAQEKPNPFAVLGKLKK